MNTHASSSVAAANAPRDNANSAYAAAMALMPYVAAALLLFAFG